MLIISKMLIYNQSYSTDLTIIYHLAIVEPKKPKNSNLIVIQLLAEIFSIRAIKNPENLKGENTWVKPIGLLRSPI